MKTRMFLFICFTAAAFVSVKPLPSFAMSTLTISPAGDSAFVMEGAGIEGAAAIELMITYDIASLANPRINEGPLISGAMTAVNPNTPGTLRMAIVTTNPVTGSGTIATLTFDRTGDSAGKINSLNARLANINGQSLPVQAHIVNPVLTPAVASVSEQGHAETTPSTSGASAGTRIQPSIPGGIILVPQTSGGQQGQKPADPSEQEKAEQPVEEIPAEDRVSVARTTERGVDAPAASQARKVHAHKSVLDRFRQYKGNAAVKKFLSFFEQDALVGFSQEPPVALSDGKTMVKLTFISVPGDRSAPSTAFLGARLVSMKRDPDYTNTWIVKANPVAGGHSASMSISQGDVMMLYPLTISPTANIDLDKSGTVTEADFNLFLKKRGSPKAPRFDLNGDKKRDYVDDYIFTANYLVKNQPARPAKE